MIDKVSLGWNAINLIIDLDSTHSDTFGNQEDTNYNAHYGTIGYHPLVAFAGLIGDLLKAELRYADILVRGYRGFAPPKFMIYVNSTLVVMLFV